MNYTPNYALTQWEKTDRIRMEDFNANNFKIEQALSMRNCRIETGTYTGTGDSSTKPTLTFSGKPLFVVVSDTSAAYLLLMVGDSYPALSMTYMGSERHVYHMGATWGENSVTYSSPLQSDQRVAMNGKDIPYRYVALIAVD